ncbi:MAG: hypothetical protein JSV49_07225 [Thermoplasmata archaeon]|nr:MAG: hypothetical protein JSV49_07225 [Thermoplasmata archaeon]
MIVNVPPFRPFLPRKRGSAEGVDEALSLAIGGEESTIDLGNVSSAITSQNSVVSDGKRLFIPKDKMY